MSNPSFKDLLSKELHDNLKSLAKPSSKPDSETGKPTEPVALMNAKQVAGEVKRFNHEQIDEDKVLFMQAMSGVAPLKTDEVVLHKPAKADENALRRRAAAEGGEDIGGNLSDMQALLNPVAGEAYLSYKNPTLQNKIFEQLKQGKLRWYDAVDLHGSSIEDARNAVQLLIHNAMTNGETVVKIVHGKGKDAIIKTCVNGWLRQISDVMAFVSAPANDGGNGAVLVLLKRKKFEQ